MRKQDETRRFQASKDSETVAQHAWQRPLPSSALHTAERAVTVCQQATLPALPGRSMLPWGPLKPWTRLHMQTWNFLTRLQMSERSVQPPLFPLTNLIVLQVLALGRVWAGAWDSSVREILVLHHIFQVTSVLARNQ